MYRLSVFEISDTERICDWRHVERSVMKLLAMRLRCCCMGNGQMDTE
jgi:hypothetical protein